MQKGTFSVPERLEVSTVLFRIARNPSHAEQTPERVYFKGYCASPAFVIVADRIGKRSRCPRDELYSLKQQILSKAETKMDQPGFQAYLRKKGKKGHVIDGLVGEAAQFEADLADLFGVTMGMASEELLREYAGRLLPKIILQMSIFCLLDSS